LRGKCGLSGYPECKVLQSLGACLTFFPKELASQPPSIADGEVLGVATQ